MVSMANMRERDISLVSILFLSLTYAEVEVGFLVAPVQQSFEDLRQTLCSVAQQNWVLGL